jgi:hypothetical protein
MQKMAFQNSGLSVDDYFAVKDISFPPDPPMVYLNSLQPSLEEIEGYLVGLKNYSIKTAGVHAQRLERFEVRRSRAKEFRDYFFEYVAIPLDHPKADQLFLMCQGGASGYSGILQLGLKLAPLLEAELNAH